MVLLVGDQEHSQKGVGVGVKKNQELGMGKIEHMVLSIILDFS